jgi:hypothetical protein
MTLKKSKSANTDYLLSRDSIRDCFFHRLQLNITGAAGNFLNIPAKKQGFTGTVIWRKTVRYLSLLPMYLERIKIVINYSAVKNATVFK